ncbi:MAG: hypothetical protein JNK82_29595 [Myxococcaceae bacterium]|nr:hypothetical protein [Myxococcaceae bacterium]
MNAQGAADLRTLVVRRAGQGRRVALLSPDAAIARAVEANGCTVLVDPDSPEAFAAFHPDVIVGFDALADPHTLQLLARTVPGAELVFSCANAGSASSVIAQLLGRPAPRGQSERQLTEWLGTAGYDVVARDRVVVPFEAAGLALDAEASLRALLEQLNPEAAADRWLWVCRRGPPKPLPLRAAGLLSAVVFDGPGREVTLAALERQSQKPLEVVSSIEEARGQYLALVMPGDTLTRDHFARLVQALQRGVSAWALESNVAPLAALEKGAVDCCAYVVDRERVGPFTLTLPRGAPAAEAVLFARLTALFPASLVAGGPSFERAHRPAPIGEALAALKSRPLRLLMGIDEALEQSPEPSLRSLLRDRLGNLVR